MILTSVLPGVGPSFLCDFRVPRRGFAFSPFGICGATYGVDPTYLAHLWEGHGSVFLGVLTRPLVSTVPAFSSIRQAYPSRPSLSAGTTLHLNLGSGGEKEKDPQGLTAQGLGSGFKTAFRRMKLSLMRGGLESGQQQ